MNQIFPPPATFSMPPGCPPSSCFDPAALLNCYSDIQALTALVTQIVQNLAATDPAFIQSIITGIEKSGSNIPLIGVTNGVDAQPGQVGEWIQFNNTLPYIVSTPTQTILFTAGVLQPGDWDVWAWAAPNALIDWLAWILSPEPPGFSGNMFTGIGAATTSEGVVFVSSTVRALISVPTLISYQLSYASATAGNIIFTTNARRRR